eukprot:scaffold1376_cov257-Pinguiococcus_pyrenoidosus.AAC.27
MERASEAIDGRMMPSSKVKRRKPACRLSPIKSGQNKPYRSVSTMLQESMRFRGPSLRTGGTSRRSWRPTMASTSPMSGTGDATITSIRQGPSRTLASAHIHTKSSSIRATGANPSSRACWRKKSGSSRTSSTRHGRGSSLKRFVRSAPSCQAAASRNVLTHPMRKCQAAQTLQDFLVDTHVNVVNGTSDKIEETEVTREWKMAAEKGEYSDFPALLLHGLIARRFLNHVTAAGVATRPGA